MPLFFVGGGEVEHVGGMHHHVPRFDAALVQGPSEALHPLGADRHLVAIVLGNRAEDLHRAASPRGRRGAPPGRSRRCRWYARRKRAGVGGSWAECSPAGSGTGRHVVRVTAAGAARSSIRHALARTPSQGPVVHAGRCACPFAVGALLVLAVRELGRSRRRARRRALLAAPPEVPRTRRAARMAQPDGGGGRASRAAPSGRPRRSCAHPRPRAEALAALNIPVTRAPDGQVAYDSWEIVHWVEVRQTDPAGFEARFGIGKTVHGDHGKRRARKTTRKTALALWSQLSRPSARALPKPGAIHSASRLSRIPRRPRTSARPRAPRRDRTRPACPTASRSGARRQTSAAGTVRRLRRAEPRRDAEASRSAVTRTTRNQSRSVT